MTAFLLLQDCSSIILHFAKLVALVAHHRTGAVRLSQAAQFAGDFSFTIAAVSFIYLRLLNPARLVWSLLFERPDDRGLTRSVLPLAAGLAATVLMIDFYWGRRLLATLQVS
jgi:hypothetical protein